MYAWVDHTGELELELVAESEREVFVQAFEAMRELLAAEPVEGAAERRIAVEARDHAVLLADWLAELAFLAESDGFVPERLASLALLPHRLEAVVEGFRGEPPHLVKAVTYHRLSLAPAGDRWRATVVLDV